MENRLRLSGNLTQARLRQAKVSFGIIALVVIIGFSMAACGDTGGGGGKDPLTSKDLTIAGTFESQNGAANGAKFYATAGSGAKSIAGARAIGSSDYELTGLLEDADITFRLKGNYNSDSKTYTLSAASSFLRYTISGGFNDAGKADTGKAVVQIKDGDEWISMEVPVTTQGTAPVISGGDTAIDETEGGIPRTMRGIWRDTNDASFYAMVNAYSVIIYEKADSGVWGEMETMYFTDVTNTDGVSSGVTAYMGWDYDKINEDTSYQWHSEMVMDYAKPKYPGKTPVADAQQLVGKFIESTYTTGGLGAVKSAFGAPYSSYITNVIHQEGWQWSPTVPAGISDHQAWWAGYMEEIEDLQYDFGELNSWVVIEFGDQEDREAYWRSDAYRDNLADMIAKYPEFNAKYKFVIWYENEWYPGWDYETPMNVMNDSHERARTLTATWANNNGYIVIGPEMYDEIWASGYEDTWLNKWITDNGKTKSDYYVQWYQKMALKIQGGKLFYGQYVQTDGSGSWVGLDWTPNDWQNDTWPVWAVNTYSGVTALSTLKWEVYGLSR